MRIVLAGILVPSVVAAASALAPAQGNVIDGLDAKMHQIKRPEVIGRTGVYPSGTVAISFDAEICNIGTVDIDWKQAMNPNHPFIKFMVAREDNGRFEQISDRSFVKHTFFATNGSTCGSCTNTGDFTVLSVGCSDVYGSSSNGDRYWLAPPDEIDPWLGDWDKSCSYFDRGDPAVTPPADCDGKRSLTQSQVDAMGPLQNRMLVSDADLDVSTANYFFFGEYLVRGEADALRDDTAASRPLTPTFNGTEWDFTVTGGNVRGSILKRWSGSILQSNTNGDDDGRVYLASKVTGADAKGIYHYEYAIHNRDNSRGLDSLQIPVCPGAIVTNAGFGDIDADPANDWTIAVNAGDVTWSGATNPLEWNTIYNFWFDCDVPSAQARTLVHEARSGTGLDAFDILTRAPMGPKIGTDLGSGKAGGNGLIPELAMCGGLDTGETAYLTVRYAAPNALTYAFISDQNLGLDFRGGHIIPYPPVVIVVSTTDAAGQLLCPMAGPGGSFDIFLQMVVLDVAASEAIAMTNALEVVN